MFIAAEEGSLELQGDPPSPFFFSHDNISTFIRLLSRLHCEIRNPKENPKENPISDFGFRISDFGLSRYHQLSLAMAASGVLAMSRILSVWVGLLLFAAPAAAADAKATTIIWHGQSFFEIISKSGTRIVLDPHAIEAFGRNTVKADVVLCSHNHTDHTRLEVIENIKDLQKKNLVFLGTRGDDKKQEWEKISGSLKDVKFRNVPLYHDDMQGMKRGKNSALIIEVDGLRIVHLGDLGHMLDDAQLKKIGEVDVLMIPVGGVYTLNGLDAQRVVEQIKPKRYILPMHYGVQGYDELLGIKYFLDGVEPKTIQRFPTTNELTVDSLDKPPKEASIAILHWEKKGEK
jgi:L-ascorbate metabolism protein UlaG (beta-lactamase superfamily)